MRSVDAMKRSNNARVADEQWARQRRSSRVRRLIVPDMLVEIEADALVAA
jgi:hypothetical protein